MTGVQTCALPIWNLNPEKLVDVKFAFKPADKTNAMFNKMHRLPSATLTPGLRAMTPSDVPKLTQALNAHLAANYGVYIKFTQDEVRHFLLP